MLRLKNPLGFPGGRPGFNLSHIASGSLIFSGAAATTGGGFFNLLSGQSGVPTGSPTSTINGQLGPVYVNPTATYTSFNGLPFSGASITIAAIIMQTAGNAAVGGIYATSTSSSTGWVLKTTSLQVELTAAGVANVLSGITLSLNVPYFVIASSNSSTTVFVVVNLLNGKIQSATKAGTTVFTGIATNRLGWDNFSTDYFLGQIAAVMASNRFMSLPTLLAWAQAPWDFWYPRTFDGIFLSGLKAAAVAAPTHFSRGFPDGGVQVT